MTCAEPSPHRECSPREGRPVGGRALIASGLLLVVGKLVTVAGSIFVIPIVSPRLEHADLGFYLVILGSFGFVTSVGAGIGSGLISNLSAVGAEKLRTDSRNRVSSTFLLAALLASAGLAIASVFSGLTAAGIIFPSVSTEVLVAATIALSVLLLDMPAAIVVPVRIARHESKSAAVWASLMGPLQVLSTGLVASSPGNSSLVAYVTAFALPIVLVDTLHALTYFWGAGAALRPAIDARAFRAIGSIWRASGAFLVLGFASIVGYQSDLVVVGATLGAPEAADFGLMLKLFALVPLCTGLILTPLWPVYARRLTVDATSDSIAAARILFRRSLIVTGVAGCSAAVAICVLDERFIELWAGRTVSSSPLLDVGFVLYVLTFAVSQPLAMLLNGAQVMRFQVKVAAAMAAVNLPLSIALVYLLGAAGPLYATATSQLICVLLPSAKVARRSLAPRPEAAPVA